MRVNKIVDWLAKNANEDMYWILVSEDQSQSEYLKSRIPLKLRAKCVFVFPLSELAQNRSDLASAIAKAAAKSMLFTLILNGEIKRSYLTYLYKLFFHLKNLGFCRVIVTAGDNQKIADFCNELNVYYEDLNGNKTKCESR